MVIRATTIALAIAANNATAGPALAFGDDALPAAAHPARMTEWAGHTAVAADINTIADVEVTDELRASAWDQLGNLAHARDAVAAMARLVAVPQRRSVHTARVHIHERLEHLVRAALAVPTVGIDTARVATRAAQADAVAEPAETTDVWPELFEEHRILDAAAGPAIGSRLF